MESGSKQDRRTTKGGGKRTGFLEDSQRRSRYAYERELKRLGFQSQTARKGETRRMWKAGHMILDAVKKDQTQIDEEYKRKLEQATSQLNQLRNLLTFRTGGLKGFLNTTVSGLQNELFAIIQEMQNPLESRADRVIISRLPDA